MKFGNLKKSDIKFFEEARKVAEQSDFPRFHVGCVVVYQGIVIATGHNSEKSDPVQHYYNRYRNFKYTTKGTVRHSIHAEIKALKSIPYPVKQEIDWRKIKVYIYRIAPGLPLKMGVSRPCPACLQQIKDLGIRNVFYTTDYGYVYERILDD